MRTESYTLHQALAEISNVKVKSFPNTTFLRTSMVQLYRETLHPSRIAIFKTYKRLLVSIQPYFRAEYVPNSAAELIPIANPIMNPTFTRSKQLGWGALCMMISKLFFTFQCPRAWYLSFSKFRVTFRKTGQTTSTRLPEYVMPLCIRIARLFTQCLGFGLFQFFREDAITSTLYLSQILCGFAREWRQNLLSTRGYLISK